MNITSLLIGTTSSLLGGNATAPQATTASSAVPAFLAQAEQRMQSSADITTAQISKFGAVKSALSDGQVAAKAMENLATSATSADATNALANFFNTFNASVSAANAASSATGFNSESQRATSLVQTLKSALSTGPALADDMKKLGLTFQTDGSLVQDPKKFAASLTSDPSGTLSAMAAIGNRVDSVSASELDPSGGIVVALSALNASATSTTAVQTALKSLEQTMATISTQDPFTSTDASSPFTGAASITSAGLTAYQSNMAGY
jgi:hypothetical protein